MNSVNSYRKVYQLIIVILLCIFTNTSAQQLGLPQRKLYTASRSYAECARCIWRGRTHCWARGSNSNGGSGAWGSSYCCGSTDTLCRSLTYCSNRVSSFGLKKFTCPIDTGKCPTGSEAVIDVSRANASYSKR